MRSGVRVGFLVCGILLAAMGCQREHPAAPIEGVWRVRSEDGRETGHVVTIGKDRITVTRPGREVRDGKASFRRHDEKVIADWYGSKVIFTVLDQDRVRMERGIEIWQLERRK